MLPHSVSDLGIMYNVRSLGLKKEFAYVYLTCSQTPQLTETTQLPRAIYCRISLALLLEKFPNFYQSLSSYGTEVIKEALISPVNCVRPQKSYSKGLRQQHP